MITGSSQLDNFGATSIFTPRIRLSMRAGLHLKTSNDLAPSSSTATLDRGSIPIAGINFNNQIFTYLHSFSINSSQVEGATDIITIGTRANAMPGFSSATRFPIPNGVSGGQHWGVTHPQFLHNGTSLYFFWGRSNAVYRSGFDGSVFGNTQLIYSPGTSPLVKGIAPTSPDRVYMTIGIGSSFTELSVAKLGATWGVSKIYNTVKHLRLLGGRNFDTEDRLAFLESDNADFFSDRGVSTTGTQRLLTLGSDGTRIFEEKEIYKFPTGTLLYTPQITIGSCFTYIGFRTNEKPVDLSDNITPSYTLGYLDLGQGRKYLPHYITRSANMSNWSVPIILDRYSNDEYFRETEDTDPDPMNSLFYTQTGMLLIADRDNNSDLELLSLGITKQSAGYDMSTADTNEDFSFTSYRLFKGVTYVQMGNDLINYDNSNNSRISLNLGNYGNT